MKNKLVRLWEFANPPNRSLTPQDYLNHYDQENHEHVPEEEFECAVSFTYNTSSPKEAVEQFMANLASAQWFVSVKNTKTGEKWVVDTDTGYTEED